MTTPSDVLEPRELGTLIVVVGKARNLPNKSRFGKQDPFCSVKLQNDKQRTKAIKRGGQHPEWDEELRFTVKEDLDEVLARSDSSADTSLSSSTSQPNVPSKDGSVSGVTTAAALANKSRKGPVKKSGGKKLNVACYADDAKEPELIGECAVDIDEVLKKGEVDEWYEFTYKDKYSGEVYLELTFYSNEAPPVKRNPHIQRYGQASLIGAGSSASLSSASRPSMASLSTSSSVSGMNLYIPPYAQPPREPSPAPPSVQSSYNVAPSTSFAQLGLPPSQSQGLSHHRNQSLPSINGHPGYPPSSLSSMASISTLHPIPAEDPLDALSRPMSSMSISSSIQSRPLPVATPMPPQPHHQNSDPSYHSSHRHSLGEAPWSTLLPPSTSAQRPLSSSSTTSMNQYQWDQIRQQNGATPLARPPSTSYPPPQPYASGSYNSVDPRAPSPIPPTLTPGLQHGGHRHAHSFSGLSGQPHPSTYLNPTPPPPPAPSHSAPPTNQYPVPSSSFPNLTQPMDPYRAETPMNPYRVSSPQPDMYTGSQTPRQQEYAQGYQQSQPQYNQQPQTYDNPSYPSQPVPGQFQPSGSTNWAAPIPPPRESTPVAYQPPPQPNSAGYVPWHQQTQPSQSSGYQSQSPYQPQPTPPPVPDYNRPAPTPPVPPRSSVGYYPSDELYLTQQHQQPQQPDQSSQAPWQQNQQPPYQSHDPHRQASPMPHSSSAPPDMYQQQQHQLQYNSYQALPQQQQQQQQHGGYPPREPSPGAPQGWQSTIPQSSYSQTPPPQQQPPYQPPYQSQAPPNHARSPSPIPPHSNGWQSQTQEQHVPPPPPGRTPSPAPPPAPGIKHDWRSYMNSLNAASGRSPSPQPPVQQAQPGQQDWYTPPPSLPSSIRPPDGWNSGNHVSQDGHQWRG